MRKSKAPCGSKTKLCQTHLVGSSVLVGPGTPQSQETFFFINCCLWWRIILWHSAVFCHIWPGTRHRWLPTRELLPPPDLQAPDLISCSKTFKAISLNSIGGFGPDILYHKEVFMQCWDVYQHLAPNHRWVVSRPGMIVRCLWASAKVLCWRGEVKYHGNTGWEGLAQPEGLFLFSRAAHLYYPRRRDELGSS